MSPALIFDIESPSILFSLLQEVLDFEVGALEMREFPDAETYVRLETPVSGRDVFLLCSMFKPDRKLLPLIFTAQAARSQGARSVQLIAPYLAYLRQDASFKLGEAVTAKSFAQVLSGSFDAMMAIDPHLHRIGSLDQVYSIPTAVLHASVPIGQWISQNIKRPLLVGPDAESEQWVAEVARRIHCPFVICHKTRHGDRKVTVELPQLPDMTELTPVLLDDIISTGQTMIQTLKLVQPKSKQPCVCLAIHAVFSGDAYQQLQTAGAAQIVTCNTIPHPTNQINLAALIADSVRQRAQVWQD